MIEVLLDVRCLGCSAVDSATARLDAGDGGSFVFASVTPPVTWLLVPSKGYALGHPPGRKPGSWPPYLLCAGCVAKKDRHDPD